MGRKLLWLTGGVLAVFALLFGIYFLLLEIGGESARLRIEGIMGNDPEYPDS